MTTHGRFIWYENLTNDLKPAVDFYTDVVGWKPMPIREDFVMLAGESGPLGGVLKPKEGAAHGAAPHWTAIVAVENADATAALAQKLGGTVRTGPYDAPSIGRSAVIADPQGASVTILAPINPIAPRDTITAGDFCWNELMTSDYRAAFDFYSQLFAWKILQDMDMGPVGTYRIFGIGEKQLGGMMTVPKDAPMPTMWIYYAEVSELEAALARATGNGATVMNGPMDVPGGRIAQISDPQGAVFALHQAVKR